jgi:mannose-1-phosphate guanylyltransferase
LLFSFLQLRRRNPCATVTVFPSDHYIREDRTFLARVIQGLDLVQRFADKIVLLGMTPDRVEPGLGYLEIGSPLSDEEGVFHVAAFVEKPSPETAEGIIRRGGLWNSFVMLFRLETMISLLRRRRLFDYEALRGMDEAAYESLTPWNFSRDFLADIPEALLVLQVDDVGWSDWGTPEAIERTFLALNVVPPWRTQARAVEVAS